MASLFVYLLTLRFHPKLLLVVPVEFFSLSWFWLVGAKRPSLYIFQSQPLQVIFYIYSKLVGMVMVVCIHFSITCRFTRSVVSEFLYVITWHNLTVYSFAYSDWFSASPSQG